MTVIAWDGNILAADRQSTVGDTIYSIRKLWDLDGGGAIAVTGNQGRCLALKRWYEDGAYIREWPAFSKEETEYATLIVVKPNGRVVYYEQYPDAIEVIDNFSAWGCGREAALGALEMGADAIKAVEVACKYITGCGRGCDWVKVTGKREQERFQFLPPLPS